MAPFTLCASTDNAGTRRAHQLQLLSLQDMATVDRLWHEFKMKKELLNLGQIQLSEFTEWAKSILHNEVLVSLPLAGARLLTGQLYAKVATELLLVSQTANMVLYWNRLTARG